MEKFLLQIHLFFLIIISLIFFINTQNLTPLSFCTKGRIDDKYNNLEKGGSCGYENHKNAMGETYLYPLSINEKFFNNFEQCGICYEIVGPKGAIRGRVEDYCSKSSESGLCSGDIYHFNIAKNGSSYIMGDANLANITFRMISCDFTENIKILTSNNTKEKYISFYVLNNNIGISYVQIQEFNSDSWNRINRVSNSNNYIYFNFDKTTIFPLKIRIFSINGDYVSLNINNPEANKVYESTGNFNVPKNTYFNIDTLEAINIPNYANLPKCCELDKSDFTPIYKDGYVNGGYNVNLENVNVIYDSNDSYLGKNSLNAKFQAFGVIIFQSNFPIRADQYNGIFFSLKSKITCDNCFYIRGHNINNNDQVIYLNEKNVWKNYTFDFDTLGITNNQFNGIDFVYNRYNEILDINIDNIILIPNPNAPDAGVCFSYSKENNYNQTSSDVNDNINSYTINSINIYDDSPKVLNIKCAQFINNENKNIVLKFISKYNSKNNFEVNNCVYSNQNLINSFNCTLPDNIADDIYNINTQTNNGLNSTYSKSIEIKNGIIICGNANRKIAEYSNEKYLPLIIIHSKEEVINKGDIVTFNIYPISQEKYNLENDEIIFLNEKQDLSLYLKSCIPNQKNRTVYSIKCRVGDNIIKGEYTNLYAKQNQSVILLEGQTIKLIGENSNGGIIIDSYSKEMNVGLTNAEKKNYNISFNILYYDLNIKKDDEFPYQVFLFGNNAKTLRRQLEDNSNYDLRVIFDKCTFGDNSYINNNNVNSLICRFPDFVPSGTYQKLESDGFETNPKNSIKLIFNNAFNRSVYSKEGNSTVDDNIHKSSSSSKKWIAWVVIIIAIVFVIALIIIIIICKKKDDYEDNTTDKNENEKDSSSAKNNTTNSV